MQKEIPTDVVYLHPRYGNSFPQITYTSESGWQIAQESFIHGRLEGPARTFKSAAILKWNEICQSDLKTLAVRNAELISISPESLHGRFKANEAYRKDQEALTAQKPSNEEDPLMKTLLEAIKDRNPFAAFDMLNLILNRP